VSACFAAIWRSVVNIGIVSSSAANNQKPRRLSGIEAGRGIAATSVALYHVARHLDKSIGAPMLKHMTQFGHAGVDFFFVISGFIILFVHYRDVGNPARLRHYAGRRFTRLMPIYWIVTALTIALNLASGHGAPAPVDFAISIPLLPSNRAMVVGVAWTLQFEILFYSVFAILILSRTVGLVVLAVWLFAIVLAPFTSLGMSNVPDQFYGTYNIEFLLGMTVAFVLTNYTVRRPLRWLVGGIILFAAAALFDDLQWLNGYGGFGRIAYGVPAAIVVAGIAEADRQSLLSVPPILRMLGSASYSIYLFQFILIGVTWQAFLAVKFDQSLPVIAQFLILVLAVLIGGAIISAWVEYPLMSFLRTAYGKRFVPTVKV
jgi:exopolysaccharide production protein ExoZ